MKKHVIVQNLDGGLGNQMFQYAFCYALARKNDICLNIFDFQNKIMPGTRENGLKYFKIRQDKVVLPTSLYLGSCKNLLNRIYSVFFKKNFKLADLNGSDVDLIKEQKNEFQNIELDLSKHIHLVNGFWQSSLYFTEFKNDIRELFAPIDSVAQRSEYTYFANLIKQTKNSVSIHVRRGDFEKCGWILDPKYYDKAIKLISEKIDAPNFFVFSDDINWCKEFFQNIDVSYIEHKDTTYTCDDMLLMSMCEHNIIANSTYSWWSAYLNCNVNKQVVAPRAIIQSTNMDILNFDDENWITI